MLAIRTRWAALLLLSIICAGCHRTPESKELAALDRAYRAGVLSKEEYQSKRQAVQSQAAAISALDVALEAGLFSQEEYRARKSKLIENAAALTALDRTYSSGVVSRDEYLAKKSGLLVSDASTPVAKQFIPETMPPPANVTPDRAPAASAAETKVSAPEPVSPSAAAPQPIAQAQPSRPASVLPAGTQGHVYRLKMVKAVDSQGFDRPMTSAVMLVPVEWQGQGVTQWQIKDKCNSMQTTLRTSGPDGRGVEIFPSFNWIWADDPKPLQMSAQQSAQFGMHTCDVMPPVRAADYARRSLARYRPNAQLIGMEPAPILTQQLQQLARGIEQSAAQYNLRQSVRTDAVRARVRYSTNGQALEEWMVVGIVIIGTLGPSYNLQTQQMGQAYTYNCSAYVTGLRAPQGQLDANEKLFEIVTSTYRIDPAWQARMDQHNQAMQASDLKGVRDRSAIVAKNAEDIRNITRQGYENRQSSMDRISEQRSQTMRGVESYRNPTTGETVELSSQYGNAWVNNRGEYILSDNPGFDPAVTFKEDWHRMERVRR